MTSGKTTNSDPSDEEDATGVALLLAHSEAEALKGYVERGRAFSALGLEDLEARYVEAFRQWVSARGAPEASPALNDVSAEFQLRSLEPPLHLVRPEMEELQEELRRRYSAMSPDEHAEITEELLAEIGKIRDSRN
jgi:hypothetical protein